MRTRRVTEIEAYYAATQLARERHEWALANPGQRPPMTARLLLHVDEARNDLSRTGFDLEDGSDMSRVLTRLALVYQPEFLLFGVTIAFSEDAAPTSAACLWQAGHLGPRLVVGRTLEGERYEITRGGRLEEFSRFLPDVLGWVSRRPELPTPTVGELAVVAAQRLASLRSGPCGVVGIGLHRRICDAWGELKLLGHPDLSFRRDVPEPHPAGVVAGGLFEGATPFDFPILGCRGFDALLYVTESPRVDAVPSLLAEAIRHRVPTRELVGATDGGQGRAAMLFVRDAEALDGPAQVPGYRVHDSWILEGDDWIEVPTRIIRRAPEGSATVGDA